MTYLILVEVDSSVGVVAEELYLESLIAGKQAVRTNLRASAASTAFTIITTSVFAIVVLPLGAPRGRGSLRAVEEALARATTVAHAVASRAVVVASS